MWSIQITTIQKFLQIHMKIKRHKQVSRLLQPDQRQKQNHKRGNLLIRQVSYRCTKENGLTLRPSEPTLASYDVSKKVISLLRHNQTVQREEDGAIQFWRIKFHLRNQSSQSTCIGLMSVGKLVWQQEEVRKEDISIALIIREQSFYLRALQGHSGHNHIDPTLKGQCNDSAWNIPSHLPHWMCDSIFTLLSTMD